MEQSSAKRQKVHELNKQLEFVVKVKEMPASLLKPESIQKLKNSAIYVGYKNQIPALKELKPEQAYSETSLAGYANRMHNWLSGLKTKISDKILDETAFTDKVRM